MKIAINRLTGMSGIYSIALALLILCVSGFYSSHLLAHENHSYTLSDEWIHLSNGQHAIGKSHGEIDIAKSGYFYLSLMSTPEQPGGIHIYSPQGKRIGDVPKAPDDFHGFVIRQDHSGQEYIYGASLKTHEIIKMTLDGTRVLTLNVAELVPKIYHNIDVEKPGLTPIKLTAIDIDNDGNIYVVDGYGLDYIHKFSTNGEYLTTFGGKQPPYQFNNCHKIHIDPRFIPNRLLCTDRVNGRLVHMHLNGELIGDYAKNLRRPSSVAFYKGIAAVAEISGRVSLLDINGNTIKTLGTNEIEAEINTNITQPEKWRHGVFTAPHGITFDHSGNLFVTEWNKWGRIVRFDVEH